MFYDIKFFSNNKFEIKRFFNYFSDKFILSENIILTITFKESEFYEKHYCKHKITIPKAIRNKMEDLDIEDTVIDWYINEDNDIVIRPRKKVCLEDVLGIIEDDDSRDAVELKRSLYK